MRAANLLLGMLVALASLGLVAPASARCVADDGDGWARSSTGSASRAKSPGCSPQGPSEPAPSKAGSESSTSYGTTSWAHVKASWTGRTDVNGYTGVSYTHACSAGASCQSYHTCTGTCAGYHGTTCANFDNSNGRCGAHAMVSR